MKVNQINIHEIIDDQLVSRLQDEFPEVFTDMRGTCKKTLRLQLTDCSGVFVRARPVPLALRGRVQRELERLERDGTIYRLEHSDFGTPIVPVVKSDGEIRVCGDYKITINPKLKRDFYPLPRIEELFANLSNGEEYTKIDLRHAYEQVLLEEDSQRYTAITTHVGTFAYRRVPYGLSCVPENFQKLMEETLRGVPGTVVFLDDICVTGRDRHTHLRNLRAVLERLRTMGLTVKLSKCTFLQKNVKYLGFIIDKEGLHPDPSKIDAIKNAPEPTDVTQLRSFLGMLNYYGKFIPNLSTLLHPLHALLKKEAPWKWSPQCAKSFEDAKRALVSKCVLAHYEEGRPLVLSVDSSGYGLGAILSHRYVDGTERPVSCVSRTLSPAEQNYSQLDKEALAIYFGITRHHQYLFGRKFVLRTDHQPLSFIFGVKGGIPQTAASRLQRWAARLAAYDFSVEFVRSTDNGPADALSRLPLSQERSHSGALGYINLVEDCLPVNCKDIKRETQKDPLLCRILGYVTFGWPSVASSEDEKPYFVRKEEIVADLGCLIYKYRIVIPPTLRSRLLEEVHEGHLGISKMKNLARNYIYWPSLDHDIEDLCRKCEPCRAVRDAPARAVLHPWEFPLHPWVRVHADFADFAGKKYLILVDAHSKWLEVVTIKRTDAENTILALRSIFARFGLVSQLVTDNGPPFSSVEFKKYCNNNLIKHVTSAPYHPQGNGAAENAVKTIKKVLKRALHEGENLPQALSKFLFQYRNSEHATTGVSPAVAMLGRRLRGRLDAVRPDVAAVVRAAQDRQIANAGGTPRTLQVGEPVLVRDYSERGRKWAKGNVSAKTGPVSFKVDMGDGREWRRHQDQLISTKNRYSLSRASAGTPPKEDSDKEEEFIDASNVSGTEESAQEPVVEPTTPTVTVQADTSRSPLSPKLSARALRAYNRNKKNV